MNRRYLVIGLTVGILFTGIDWLPDANAGRAFVVGSTFCRPHYNKWKKWPGWKAFALNTIIYNKQVCGWAYKAPSKQVAIAEALRYCRKNERKSPGFGRKGSCYVYDVQR